LGDRTGLGSGGAGMSGTEDFRQSFFEECEELLEALQDGLDAMDGGEDDRETMNAVFRAVHSIKGGAGAFGFSELVDFAHDFETALDQVRAGKLEAGADLLDLFRQCSDNLSDLVTLARDHGDTPCDASGPLRARLADAIGAEAVEEANATPDFEPMVLDLDLGPDPGSDAEAGPASSSRPDPIPDLALPALGPATAQAVQPGLPMTYRLRFTATPELFASGNDPVALFKTLEKLGELTCEADCTGVPPLSALEPLTCALTWQLDLTTEADEATLREVFEFVEDISTLEIETVPNPAEHAHAPEAFDTRPGQPDAAPIEPDSSEPAQDAALPSLATLIEQAGEADHAPLEDDDADGRERDAASDMSAASPKADEGSAPEATARQASPQAKTGNGDPRKPAGTIRVDLDKIDKLINLVGELVIKEAMLSQTISDLSQQPDSEVTASLENLKQLAGEIQEGVMAIRAQPVKPMFQRMARIVREAASATGKRVRLVTIGEYAEVDKTVLERLVDPLTHMIRNAIDHGLETGAQREAAGKPVEGTVTLSAAHRSGRVMIDVADDGGGINRERVRALAIERGLISEQDQLTHAEIDNLLFLPGFSSKDEVSQLSGRGVGLDVVRSEIQTLGGRVSIQSDPGEGTTFSISLPLTLAVVEGMVIKVAGQTMVVPISAIQETLQPKPEAIQTIGAGGQVLRSRNNLVPIIDLGSFFGFRAPPDRIDDRVVLMIETDNHHHYALVVDEIQDQRQVVIKSLETNYQQVGGVAAATILGDGRIALIIDPDRIVGTQGLRGLSDLSLQAAE
jgi:two-component system chemotaxis sensor kinase CheA